jgi:Cu+-exporting ATPase
VNAIDGNVSFEIVEKEKPTELARGVEAMGYRVEADGVIRKVEKKQFLQNHLQRFLFCLPFTLVLMLHMIPGLHIHVLMNPWVQLALTLPVFYVGMSFFGRSAIKSLRNGIPNMNVLISTGAIAAFGYSLIGAIMGLGDDYLFSKQLLLSSPWFFLGEYLEHASVQRTQRSLTALVKSQKVMANMIAFDDQHQELIFPIENTQLKVGDLVQINTGEQVPADCKILWGDAQVNEALLTGESLPVAKGKKDFIIGGSVVGRRNAESTGNGRGWRHGSFQHHQSGEKSTRRKAAHAANGRSHLRHFCTDSDWHSASYAGSKLDRSERVYTSLVAKHCGAGDCLSMRYGVSYTRGHCRRIGTCCP